jgi:hypothetical protein
MSEIKVNKISPRTNCGTVTVGDAGDSVTVTAGVPVTVNGDLKSNALKAVDGGSIISQCGTNITLGASGDTINLAAGASQTGFGRTGTVDWDTTAKTAGFTAVSGTGYFVNTTSGAITMNLPASPSAGDIVAVKDYANTFDTNNLVIDRNGSVIDGVANNFEVTAEGQSLTLVYVDGTRGWVPTDAAKASDFAEQALFTVATGGTITCCGDYKIHTFTSPGTFTVTTLGNGPTVPTGGPSTVSYMVIAGGGGTGGDRAGGGGAGGFREGRDIAPSYTASPLVSPTGLTITATTYPVTVGAGGAATPAGDPTGTAGSPSIFSTITSAGGGYPRQSACGSVGGGSGGGGNQRFCGANCGGAGNTPPVSPPQGNPGGDGSGPPVYGAGGGGGAGGAGSNGSNTGPGGPGGPGVSTSITSSPVTYAGGGGGSVWINAGTGGTGGPGGGGNAGSTPSPVDGVNGTANTGGGAGGGSAFNCGAGASGGSGIVIIRYKFQ